MLDKFFNSSWGPGHLSVELLRVDCDENRPNEMVRAMARVSLALSAQGR